HLFTLSGKKLTKYSLGMGVYFDSIPVSSFGHRYMEGAVNVDGEILLPPLYKYVYVDKDRIVYSSGDNTKKNTIKFDSQGKFVEQIKNFGTIYIIDTTEYSNKRVAGKGRIEITRKRGERFGTGTLNKIEIRDRGGEIFRYSKYVLYDSVSNKFAGSAFLDAAISTLNENYVAPAITLMGQMALVTRSGRLIKTLSFKNDRGKIQPAGFNMVGNFHEGLAAVDFGNPDYRNYYIENLNENRLDGKSNAYRNSVGKWGFINTNGKLVIPPQFSTISDFEHGTCIVSLSNKGYQVIDPSGNLRLEKFYHKIERDETNDSLFLVQEPGSSKGLLNKYYKISISPRFMDIRAVSEGMFSAKGRTNKWAFYHIDGKPLTDSIYTNIRPFTNGYAAVSQKGKWGIIDSVGITVVPPTYTNISDIYTHRYFAEVKDNVKIFDTNGKTVTSKHADYVKYLGNGTLIAAKGDKKGLLNLEGKWIVEPIYESISGWSADGTALGQIDKKRFIIHL
ncbi:MAG: WG repeat-containing protein, partial [Cytophagales bacterium]|nr:WG repeat-containing protein [Cytophagales bacterium]